MNKNDFRIEAFDIKKNCLPFNYIFGSGFGSCSDFGTYQFSVPVSTWNFLS